MANRLDVIFPIKKIEFCVFQNDEIRRYSIARKTPYGLDVPDTIIKGEPVIGGPLDPRLGSTNASRDCNTCGCDSEECPSHMGHLVLPEPVYNRPFIVYVRLYLSCLCLECSRVPIPLDNPLFKHILKHSSKFNRASQIKKLTLNVKICPFCGALKPKIKKDAKERKDVKEKKDKDTDVMTIYAEYIIKSSDDDDDSKKKEVKDIRLLKSKDVYNILNNMDDETCHILGIDFNINRASDLLVKNWPISAPAIRPSVKADYMADGTSEDDLTKKTLEVVRNSDKIRKFISAQKLDKATRHMDLLQCSIAVYATGSKGADQNSNTKAIKSVAERVSGKNGRLRHDLEGKRTNFCARSVISSDPNISISQGGIPLHIAMVLTIPVTVRKDNIETLTQLVRNGRYVYPGANYVRRFNSTDNVNIDLKHTNKFIKLRIGDVVERHLQDNDPVLFNRQPSLHKMGIMCHRSKICRRSDLSVLRLNVNVTQPYGADFDKLCRKHGALKACYPIVK